MLGGFQSFRHHNCRRVVIHTRPSILKLQAMLANEAGRLMLDSDGCLQDESS